MAPGTMPGQKKKNDRRTRVTTNGVYTKRTGNDRPTAVFPRWFPPDRNVVVAARTLKTVGCVGRGGGRVRPVGGSRGAGWSRPGAFRLAAVATAAAAARQGPRRLCAADVRPVTQDDAEIWYAACVVAGSVYNVPGQNERGELRFRPKCFGREEWTCTCTGVRVCMEQFSKLKSIRYW